MKILEPTLKAIIQHAQKELPYEACGYLAEKEGVVQRHSPLTNTDKAADHFSMDPKEQFAAIKAMRADGTTLTAIYHSHPETPARPSDEDIRLAFDPKISYVIISLAEKEAVVKSFKIAGGVVQPEEIVIITEAGPECPKHGGTIMSQVTLTPDRVKNCRGVGCPMNLVYAKVELSKLEAGQILEIILDDGPPVNNVPASTIKEGHEILAKRQLEDGAWSVLIKKAGK